ncbi:sporulation protein YpjB [Paenibacillus sp. DS2015]|uniref:sporulation protein YpjB n=1 Tax=Paenibacillus sp. DS2015 TaxID=3373917 RepID=UPI003D2545CD
MLCRRLTTPALWVLVILLLSVIVSPVFVYGEGKLELENDKDTSVSLKQALILNTATEKLYRLVLEGNTDQALQELTQIQMVFESSSFQGLTKVEGVHVLAECIVELKEATAQAQVHPEQWLNASAKLRLAVDSLSHPRQPLWLQYYKVVSEDLNAMKKTLIANNRQALKQAYDSLQGHYELIRPSVVIQREPYEVRTIDSWLSYAGGLSSSGSSEAADIRSMLGQGEELLNELFGKKKDQSAFASLSEFNLPWKGIMLGGIFILFILIYVGYRKYRGEQDRIRKVPPRS